MRFGVALFIAALAASGGAVAANCLLPADLDVDNLIEISEGLRFDMMSRDRLIYRIVADQGLLEEASRVIWLDGPRVEIYDAQAGLAKRVHGDHGRLWPVTIRTVNDQGKIEETRKFDWALCGSVVFESTEGYYVETSELAFSAERQLITSEQGVVYRFPVSQGESLYGEARGFVAEVDPETRGLSRWTLHGPGELKFNKGS